MLAATGVAGHPRSSFHRPSLDDWRRGVGLPAHALHADIFAAVRERARAGTDCFGIRLQQHSFAFFIGQLRDLYPDAANDATRIEAAFGPVRYLWLTRRSKLDQAISYLMAEQSGLWHRNRDGSELERIGEGTEPRYDYDAIAAQIETFEAYDAAWAAWFEAQGIAPHRVDYDALAAAPSDTLHAVLAYLDLPHTAARDVRPPTAKLANAANVEWAARFRADTLALGGKSR